tara:strand:+ start:554 stop:1705 length:1152 start_codon:yes stop_codon:yes gene_type:complete
VTSKVRLTLLALVLLVVVAFTAQGLHQERQLRAQIHPPSDAATWPFLWEPLKEYVYESGPDLVGLEPGVRHFRSSSLGLRGPELDPSTDPIRILTLGGSVTECALLADGSTWPDRLQQMLSEALPQDPIWVGNGGKSGHAVLDYEVHARTLVPALRPDIVVVMPGGNDLQAHAEDRYFPADLSDQSVLKRYQSLLYQPQGANSIAQLQLGYRQFLKRVRQSRHVINIGSFYKRMRQTRTAAVKLPELPDFDLLSKLYASNLERLLQALRAAGVGEVVLATHPFLWSEQLSAEQQASLWAGYSCMNCATPRYYSAAALASGLRRLNELTLAACAAHQDVICADVEPAVPKTLANFYDDAHLQPAGAVRVAKVVAEALLNGRLSQ